MASEVWVGSGGILIPWLHRLAGRGAAGLGSDAKWGSVSFFFFLMVLASFVFGFRNFGQADRV